LGHLRQRASATETGVEIAAETSLDRSALPRPPVEVTLEHLGLPHLLCPARASPSERRLGEPPSLVMRLDSFSKVEPVLALRTGLRRTRPEHADDPVRRVRLDERSERSPPGRNSFGELGLPADLVGMALDPPSSAILGGFGLLQQLGEG
jgi:hypothetical protein